MVVSKLGVIACRLMIQGSENFDYTLYWGWNINRITKLGGIHDAFFKLN